MEPSQPVSDPAPIGVDLTLFDRIWDELMSRTISTASRTHGSSSSFGHKYYAADVASLTTFQIIYAMVQCTPDVSSGDCEFCLKRTVLDYKKCCRGHIGGAFVRPFCFIRWDLYPFAGAFENITLPSPPPPLSLTPPSMKLKISFLPTFLIFLISLDSVTAQEICFSGFFKPNSTYDLNRRQILSTLASNVTTHNGFFNSKIGQAPNRVFIIGMCIPGTKPETCSDCIKGASDKISESCPNKTDAYTWPDCCMVRYSNISFSGSLVMEPSETLYHTGDIEDTGTNLTMFDRIWEELMLRAITAASVSSSNGSSFGQKYFAAEVAPLTTFQTMYAMMQCTPDVSSKDCEFCLKTSVGDYESCCRGKQGGAVIRPSCFVRWDLYPYAGAFENVTFPPPPPQSLPQPPLSLTPPPVSDQANTTIKDGKSFSTGIIVAIVVPIIVILVSLVVLFVVCRRKKSYETTEVQATDEITTTHSLQFSFKTIEAATDKFSDSNMIGRGGFGEVYRVISSFSSCNLVTHAWRLWRNGSPLELVDPTIGESYQSSEATRCIHIALLCVQEDPADRPLLPAIIMMLTSSTTTLHVPRAPGFCLSGRDLEQDGVEYTESTSRSIPGSINDASITEFYPR
ncbi:unnamed protein product [Arabidopsis thaliana]|uniref:(thale cress) hypothetical protein n=1 Tax=Arabidopsis thaliana TaxID=3702 RepID=A0A7G2F300_ARATH|nr:unnamed protein product [Arabidopsis thaliana]